MVRRPFTHAVGGPDDHPVNVAGPHGSNEQADADELDRLRVLALVPVLRRGYVMSVLSIAVFSAILFHTSHLGLLGWLAIRLTVTAASVWALDRMDMTVPPTRNLRTLTGMLLVGGSAWGLIPFLVRPDERHWQAVVVLWLLANQSVVTASCAPHRRVFMAAIGSVTLVGTAGVLTHGTAFSLVLALLLLLGGVYSVSLFRAMHVSVTSGMVGQIENARLASSLRDANERLERLSSTDELTSMMNRRRFREAIADPDGTLRSSGAMLIIDVDRFKTINDGLGHQVGDLVLGTLAARWIPLIEPVGFAARLGGDEFACFLPEVSQDDAAAAAEALRDGASAPIPWGGPSIRATCSIGVTMTDAGTQVSIALARADGALYEAKRRGRDAVVFGADPAQGPTGHHSDSTPR